MSDFTIIEGDVTVRKSDGTEVDLATETKLEAVRALIASLDGKDYATEATLESVRLLLASLDGKDFATQTTLAALNAKLGALGQKAMAGSAPVVVASDQSAVASKNAAASQLDGHSQTLGATGDGTSANTVIGRLKNLLSRWPAALGQAVMSASFPTVIASDQSAVASKNAAASQVDGHSATLGATTDADTANTVIGRLKQIITTFSGGVKILDGSGSGRLANVDSANRLVVTANATIVPPASLAVDIEVSSDLTGTSDTAYIIPSGKNLTITRFAGGSEGNSGKVTEISLYNCPTGTVAGAGTTLIRQMFVGTSNWEYGLDVTVLGDGTRAIVMRRDRLDGASDKVGGFWSGFRDI